MVVNEVDFKRALKSVSDSFKIPWLYSIEAFFKGKDVFAVTSMPCAAYMNHRQRTCSVSVNPPSCYIVSV